MGQQRKVTVKRFYVKVRTASPVCSSSCFHNCDGYCTAMLAGLSVCFGVSQGGSLVVCCFCWLMASG
jgi:hypothetical protein